MKTGGVERGVADQNYSNRCVSNKFEVKWYKWVVPRDPTRVPGTPGPQNNASVWGPSSKPICYQSYYVRRSWGVGNVIVFHWTKQTIPLKSHADVEHGGSLSRASRINTFLLIILFGKVSIWGFQNPGRSTTHYVSISDLQSSRSSTANFY